jgi:hypothetical protein
MIGSTRRLLTYLLLITFTSIYLLGCSAQFIRKALGENYQFDTDPKSVIIQLDQKTWPLGDVPGQDCNYIPNLRIWGDGKVVYADFSGGNRRVLTGTISKDKIIEILKLLDKYGFFNSPQEEQSPSNITGYGILVNVNGHSFHSFSSEKNETYDTILSLIDVNSLIDFIPEKGFLVVGPYRGFSSIDTIPEWTSNISFSLSELVGTGRWINGSIAEYVWNTINEQSEPLTGMREGSNVFAIGLEVESISPQDPPFDCFNR